MDNFLLVHSVDGEPFLLDFTEVRGFKPYRGATLIVFKNPMPDLCDEVSDAFSMNYCSETVNQLYSMMKARRGWLRA